MRLQNRIKRVCPAEKIVFLAAVTLTQRPPNQLQPHRFIRAHKFTRHSFSNPRWLGDRANTLGHKGSGWDYRRREEGRDSALADLAEGAALCNLWFSPHDAGPPRAL